MTGIKALALKQAVQKEERQSIPEISDFLPLKPKEDIVLVHARLYRFRSKARSSSPGQHRGR